MDPTFDDIDRRLLRTIIDKFGGGPVGLGTIAAAISEERDAIEDAHKAVKLACESKGAFAYRKEAEALLAELEKKLPPPKK